MQFDFSHGQSAPTHPFWPEFLDRDVSVHMTAALKAGIAAANPAPATAKAISQLLESNALPERPALVCAIGKVALPMMDAALSALPIVSEAIAISPWKPRNSRLHSRVRVMKASHPHPTRDSLQAGETLRHAIVQLYPADCALFLLSGGASSLACVPAPGVSLSDKRATIKTLMSHGASISDINTVRRHLSQLKGGRLAQLCPANLVHTLAISDVEGDAPRDIGSGYTVPDSTTLADARAVLDRYDVVIPTSIRRALANTDNESCKQLRAELVSNFEIVVSPDLSLRAAERTLKGLGYKVIREEKLLNCSAQQAAKSLVRRARKLQTNHERIALISGGEVTTKLGSQASERSMGGPNQEFAFCAALELSGSDGIYVGAIDTDGIDGAPELGAAGAISSGLTLQAMQAKGVDTKSCLDRSDSGLALQAVNNLIITGPTGTNVNDLRIILIHPPQTRHID